MKYLKPDIESLRKFQPEPKPIIEVPFWVEKIFLSLKLYVNNFKINLKVEKLP
jgi:hypothetical protein